MAKTTAPLFSFGASGQLGKSIVYSNWKGVSYARQYMTPANPKSVSQVATRTTFQWVHDAYKYLDPKVQESWVAYSKGQPFTPANAWMTANLSELIGATDIEDIVFSKPVNSGPPAISITPVATGTQIIVTMGTPTLPTGWTITEAIMIVMQDVTPAGEMEFTISKAATAVTSPYTATFTGLKSAQKYICGGWFKVLRADNIVAYGGQLSAVATTP